MSSHPNAPPDPPDTPTVPQDLEAERRIIGAVILDPACLPAILDAGCEAAAFHDPFCGAAFAASCDAIAAGETPDPVSVVSRMRGHGGHNGVSDLTAMVAATTTTVNAAHWARLVVACAHRRRVLVLCAEVAALARTDPDAAGALAAADAGLADLRRGSARTVPPTAEDVLRRLAASPPQVSYPSGYADYDALTGGLHERQLVTIVGPTGAGKTAFVISIAAALCRHLPVLWVAAEIDAEEMGARIAGAQVGARVGDILAQRVPAAGCADAVAGWPLHLVEIAPGSNDQMGAIRARAEAVARATGHPPAIVVDYLQLLAVNAGPSDVRLTVSAVAVSLRDLARDLHVPLIAIASTSRAFYAPAARKQLEEDGDDPRTYLAAAKESGDIEYASAVVAFLDVAPAEDSDGSRPARLAVAKSRRGRTGFVGLRFEGAIGRWRSDPSAAAELGPGRRNAEAERAVLAAVERTRAIPQTWRDLRSSIPGRHCDADAAKARLLAEHLIALRAVVGPTGSGGRQRRQVVILPDWRLDPLPDAWADVQ